MTKMTKTDAINFLFQYEPPCGEWCEHLTAECEHDCIVYDAINILLGYVEELEVERLKGYERYEDD